MPKIGRVRQPRDAKGRFRSTKRQKAIIAKSRRSATKPTLASMKGAEKWVVFRKKDGTFARNPKLYARQVKTRGGKVKFTKPENRGWSIKNPKTPRRKRR